MEELGLLFCPGDGSGWIGFSTWVEVVGDFFKGSEDGDFILVYL